jgi:hypothetical protein
MILAYGSEARKITTKTGNALRIFELKFVRKKQNVGE